MIRTLVLSATMTTFGALPVFLLSAQSVMIRQDLHFSEPELGIAVSAFFGAAALTSLLVGPVVERLGPRWSMLLGAAIGGGSAAGVVLAAHSYTALLLLLLIAGAANALLHLAANLALARGIPVDRRGIAFGIKQSAIPASILVAGLAVPALGVRGDWRWPFGATVIAAVLLAVAALRMPASCQRTGSQETRGERAPLGALAVTAAAVVLSGGAMNAMSAFLPAWAYNVGLSPGTAGLLLAAAGSLSIVGRVIAGLAADRRRGRNLPVVVGHIGVGAVAMVLIGLASTPSLVVGTLLVFAIGWSWPGLLMFAIVRLGRDAPAAATGIVQAGAFAGGAVGPTVFGVLVAETSYPTSWFAAAGALVVSCTLFLIARTMFRADLVRRPRILGAPS